jgi:hypothetical protein
VVREGGAQNMNNEDVTPMALLSEEWSENQTDIPALEAEIDRLVYALYGLTDEEIAVVKGKR